MFKINFTLKKKTNGSLYMVLPIWFRIVFLFIVVLLAAGVFVSDIGSSEKWIPILFITACIWGALYEEKWIFDNLEQTIVYITGTIIINKKKNYKFEDIELFNITGDLHSNNEGIMNRLRKKMIKFSLILNSGKVLDIDITTGKSESTALKQKAQLIADYCGIELAVDN